METLVLVTILALVASPIYAEGEASAEKKVEKRGVLGLGYGSYGYGHPGYLNAPVYSLGHGIAPSYSHTYTAPLSINHGYTAPGYTVPRFGYHGIGHGLNYLQGW